MKGLLITILKDIKVFWKTFFIVIIPVVLSPLVIISNTDEAKCGYAISVMALYWILELFPLPVTALIPVFFFPFLGLMGASKVAMLFFQDTTMIFLGGFMIALAIERVNLHNRIGTGVLLVVGSTPARILIGFLLPTCFLSMWISNTATTSMMVPAVEAVIEQYRRGVSGNFDDDDEDDDDGEVTSGVRRRKQRERAKSDVVHSDWVWKEWGVWDERSAAKTAREWSESKTRSKSFSDMDEYERRKARRKNKNKQNISLGLTTNVVLSASAGVADAAASNATYITNFTTGSSNENKNFNPGSDSVIEIQPISASKSLNGQTVTTSTPSAKIFEIPTSPIEANRPPTNSPSQNTDTNIRLSIIEKPKLKRSNSTKEATEKQTKNFAKMLCIAIAFGSLVGGTGTLTGSTTNLLVAEEIGTLYESHGLKNPISYANWLLFGVPHVLISLLILWLILQLYFIGWRSLIPGKLARKICPTWEERDSKNEENAVREILKEEYAKLGPLNFGEITVIMLMVLLVVLWIFRDPGFMPGYSKFFKDGYLSDSFPPMLITLLLFVLPLEKPDFICWRSDGSEETKIRPAILNWETVSEKLPWGPIILIGGGFVLAEGCEVSGLSKLLAHKLEELSGLDPWIMSFLLTVIVSFVTEIMTNVTVMAIFSPIFIAMAEHFNVNPLYFVFPSGVAASYAYMLPIAAPSNAIVFAYGHLTVVDLLKVGFGLKVISLLILTALMNTLGDVIFDLHNLPWSNGTIGGDDFTTSAAAAAAASDAFTTISIRM
ncbi:hypothetical protein HELRODRAFT_177066 [Helobdella robusta]|uniref:Citrate transporter-like domain-containing protein n=1 Tax=Helobdella robusta TaxID=6412 RepID=T1FB70_HELRO|nr:hypothetical protein HELRODRAFT_177066 [Helobdella robusta]ESN98586.1 hypothetical protein HELRODRAFT_177066 [Helobdella robusta]